MPDGGYSAGSIFLQVIPSFRGVPEAIAREGRTLGAAMGKDFDKGFEDEVKKGIPDAVDKAHKDIGDTAQKSGKEAGKKYGGAFQDSLRTAIRDTQRELQATLKVSADDGDVKAKLASIAAEMKALGKAKIGVNMDADKALATLTRLTAEVKAVQTQAEHLDIKVNTGAVLASLEKVSARIHNLSNIDITPTVKIDDRQIGAFEAKLRAAIKAASAATAGIKVDADINPAEHRIQELRAELLAIGDMRVGIDIDAATATAEIGRIAAELEALGKDRTISFQAQFDAAAASTELAALGAEADRLDGDTIHIQAAADTAAAEIKLMALAASAKEADGATQNLSRSVGDAGNSFRAFSGIVLGVVALGPAIVPALVAMAGAAAALGPLGAVGLVGGGTAALGLSGISKAVKALSQEQKNAVQDAVTYEKTVRAANNSVIGAQNTLDNAVTNSARNQKQAAQAVVTAENAASAARVKAVRDANQSAQQIATADRGVATAERGLASAQESARKAQADLTQARKDAVAANRDLQLSARGGALAERQAVLDLADAQTNYNKIVNDPKSTTEARQRALIDLEQQKLSLDEIRARNSDIAAQQAQFAKTGVNGTQQVISAQQRLQQATQGVGDAQQQVADAQRNAAAVRADAASRAIDDQRAIAAADARVADARAAQSQAAVASQRSIADAQRGLAAAQANYRDALDKTSASQRGVTDAMAKLGPAGQQFARFLFSLGPYLAQLRQAAGQGFLPGLQKWFQVIVGFYGPALLRTLSGISSALGGMFGMFATALMAPPFQKFFAMIERDGPIFIGMFGQILTNLGLGVASLVTALEPLGFLFGGWLVQATAAFAKWAGALSTTTGFGEFITAVKRDAPLVGKFLWALGGALMNLGISLLPYAEGLLKVLTAVLNWVANMDPGKLAAIAIGIIAIVLAFQIIVGLNSLISGLASAWGVLTGAVAVFTGTAEGAGAILAGIIGTVALVVVALALIGTALYLAYTHFDWFHRAVDQAWQGIQTAVHAVVSWFQTSVVPILQSVWKAIAAGAQWLWTQILAPIWNLWQHIWTDVMNGIVWAWKNIGGPLFSLIGSIISFLWTGIIQPIWSNIAPLIVVAFKVIAAAWNAVGKPVFDAILAIVRFLWDYVFKPIFIAIGFAFKVLVDAMAWAWNNILKPVFTVMMAVAQVLFRILVVVVFGAIRLGWEALILSMKALWDNILHPVWKLIAWAINDLWTKNLKPAFDNIGKAWDWVVRGMKTVHDKILLPMWGVFKGALKALADYFGFTTKTVGGIWDSIKAIVATPINFVIGMVFNKGLFKAWNWAINALGLPKGWAAPVWPQIKGKGIPQFAAGGRVPGWSPHDKADNIPAMLTAKEFVHPVDAVDYYGVDTMELIRRKKIPREALAAFATGGLVQNYAVGGKVASMDGGSFTWQRLDDIRRRMFPGSVLTSAYRPGANDYHGRGEAIDIGVNGNLQSGLMPIAAAIAKAFPNSTELIHNPNGSIKNGHQVPASFWGPATWAAHANHVHWAMTPAALSGAPGGGSGQGFFAGIWSGIKGFLGKTWKTATDVFGSLTDSIKDVGQLAGKFGNSQLVQAAAKTPGNLLGKMWTAAKDKVGQFFSDVLLQGATESPLTQNAAGYQQMARRVLVPFGWGSGPQWDAFNSVVTRESGWNPTAQNPVSTASGLGQFINSTWAQYRGAGASQYPTMKSAPPGQQVVAVANYMRDRYRDAIGAKTFWDRNHWYGEGGEVTEAPHGQAPITPELMDTGGYIRPGLNVIMNKTRRAEPVINPATLDSLHAIANSGGSGQALIGELNLPIMTQATPEAIAGEILHSVTVARRGGKY